MVIVCVRVRVEAGAVLGLWLRLGFGGRVGAGIRVFRPQLFLQP